MPDLPPLPPLSSGRLPAFRADEAGFTTATRAARRRVGAAFAGGAGVVAAVVALVLVASSTPQAGLAPARPGPSERPLPPSPLRVTDGVVRGDEPHQLRTPPPTTGPDGPLEVTITAEPAEAPTATMMRFTVRVLRPFVGRHWFRIDFGDGRTKTGRELSSDPTCDDARHDVAHDIEEVVEYAYRTPGTYDVTVSARHVGPCGKPVLTATDTVRVVVAPGPLPSNGPAQPLAAGAMRRMDRPTDGPDSPLRLRLSPLYGRDDDGWVSRMELDWGDGSEPLVADLGLAGCNGTATSWPHGHRMGPPAPEHTYAARGTYVVRLTVTSTGCDGRDPQTATREITYRI